MNYGIAISHKVWAKKVEVVGVIYEQKANKHEKTDYGSEGNEIVARHFAQRTTSEKFYFENRVVDRAAENFESVEIHHGQANSEEMFSWIKAKKPDIIQLFGSSLIKDHLLDAFPQRVVNIHLGLSPYYRGSGTNFWPFVHHKPECVGATIHLAVKKVDAGAILHQFRPSIQATDSIHDVGNKIIRDSPEILAEVLRLYHLGKIDLVYQDLQQGIVCYRKDLTPASIGEMYDNFAQGIIPAYLSKAENRKAAYPIVENLNLENKNA